MPPEPPQTQGRPDAPRRGGRGDGGDVVSASGGSSPPDVRITGWRKWVLRAVLVVVSPLAIFAVLETALRLAGFGHPTGFFVTADGGQTWTENPRFAWPFSSPAVASEPEPVRLAAARPAGACRIFVLGESAAQGTPDPAYSFGRILQVMLRERHPGTPVEVVNAAVMGISSHAIRLIARDCAARGGDVFIIYMGNNELMGPYSPLASSPAACSSLGLVRAAVWARSTRTGQLVEEALRRMGGGDGAPPQTLEVFLASAVSPDDPRRETVCAHFRANLEDILGTIRGAGARAVVATVATNVADCAPLASRHRAGLDAAARAEFGRLLDAGADAEAAGRLAEAERAYRRALELDDRFAEAHFRLGRCLGAMGRPVEARLHGARARDLDALPFRTVGALNDAVRDAARGREAEGIYLVDAEAAFEAAAGPQGAPGEESFYEHCHMTFGGNCRLAAALLPAVEAALSAGPAAAPPPSPGRCAELLAFTDRDRYRMAAAMADLAAKPPLMNRSDGARRLERVRRLAAHLAALQTREACQRCADAYEAACRRDPDDWYPRHHLAILRLELGDAAGAAAQWREVLRLVPHHVEARVRLGDALVRQGRMTEAQDLWAEALCGRPECLQAINRMADALTAQGRLDEAAAWAERAIRLRPDAAQHRCLGSLLARQGKADEAIRAYRRGLERHPEDVGLREGLAAALASRKEFAEAAAEFEALLAAAPEHLAARCALARALENLGRTEEAAGQYRLALALNPRMPEALAGLQSLGAAGEMSDDVLGTVKKASYLGGPSP
ncbi:MAG: tetratricopeptide repeat protein [Planctomycetes bacterium]|nr:tetratricopeptide repeat protein [Planctomycetota bacterium]